MTDAAQSAGPSMRETVQPFAGEARPGAEEAQSAAERQKAVGAAKAKALADAVRKAADDLQPELPLAAAYIRGAAEKLQQASAELETRSVDDLIGSLSDAARNRPATVFGVAAIAGLAFSFLLRNSGANPGGRPPAGS